MGGTLWRSPSQYPFVISHLLDRLPSLIARLSVNLPHIEDEPQTQESPSLEQHQIEELERLVESPRAKLRSVSTQIYSLRQELAVSNRDLHSTREGQRAAM